MKAAGGFLGSSMRARFRLYAFLEGPPQSDPTEIASRTLLSLFLRRGGLGTFFVASNQAEFL